MESFQRNGQEPPLSITDSTRWRKVAIGKFPTLRVRTMDDTGRSLAGEIDERSRSITVWERWKPAEKSKLTYFQPDRGHVLLSGKFGPAQAGHVRIPAAEPGVPLDQRDAIQPLNRRA